MGCYGNDKVVLFIKLNNYYSNFIKLKKYEHEA